MKTGTTQVIVWFCIFILSIGVRGQECPQVNVYDVGGNTSVTLDCSSLNSSTEEICVDLQVDYTQINATENYTVSSIAYSPEIPYSQGSSALAYMTPDMENGVDDKFSSAIPLGFDFCFYDQTFSQVFIGSNGLLSFSQENENADCPSGISFANPHPNLISNGIFAVQHDIAFENNGSSGIYYEVVGNAPCRRFVVNYYNGKLFGCEDYSTTQIVLYEMTNVIEVYIEDKPEFCDNGRTNNSLLGIMNQEGTLGVSPNNRNTGEWGTSEEAWRFTPSGTPRATVQWADQNGTLVGEENQVTVCPNQNMSYTATVSYNNCQDDNSQISDTINVTIDENLPVVGHSNITLCDSQADGTENVILSDYNGYISFNNEANFTFQYYNSLSDAQSQLNEISEITISGNSSVFVRIQSNQQSNCYIIREITLSFQQSDVGEDLSFSICDNNNDGSESDVDLAQYIEPILTLSSNETYSIHLSESDAASGINPVTTANLSTGSEIWVNVTNSNGCMIISPVSFNFLEAPNVPDSGTISYQACDINYNHSEYYDWEAEIRTTFNIPALFGITVHNTMEDAENGTSATTLIRDNLNQVFARIENQNGCYSIITIDLEVAFYGVDASNYTHYICFDGTEDVSFDLSSFPLEMLNQDSEGIDISLYSTSADANDHSEETIPYIQTLSEDGYLVTQSYFVRFQLSDDCYTVRSITVSLVHPIAMENPIDVCDIYNDNSEENDLNLYDAAILGDQVGSVSYFLNLADAENNQNEITSYNFTEETTLYAKITSHGCSEIYPVGFQLLAVLNTNSITEAPGGLCDENGDGYSYIDLTYYQSDILPSGSTDVFFEYYLDYDEISETFSNPITTPEAFYINQSTTIYVKVNFGSESCYSVAILNLEIDSVGSPVQPNNVALYKCDYEFDLNEIFTLSEAIPEMLQGTGFSADLYQISYHLTSEEALSGENPLETTFSPNSAEYPIYVRFQAIISSCVSVGIVTLNTLPAPKPVTGNTTICDNNINGSYDLDLTTLNEIVMGDNTAEYTFSYFLTEQNARDNINPLNPDEIYEASPFPFQIWVRVNNGEDCFDVNYVSFEFTPVIDLPYTETTLYACEESNEGYAHFDLTELPDQLYADYDMTFYLSHSDLEEDTNAISNVDNYENTTINYQTIYAKVQNDIECPTDLIIHLQVNPMPKVDPIPIIEFCPGDRADFSITTYAANYQYNWYSPDGEWLSSEQNLLDVSVAGIYTLQVVNPDYPDCVLNLEAVASVYTPPAIVELIGDETQQTISVIAVGDYQMEYSIDGINWQSSNTFSDLQLGMIYTFYVRYVEQGCLGETQQGALIEINNFITPNGDGYNDQIVIKNLFIYNGEPATFSVYDRYGKLIFHAESNTEIVWDGFYMGRTLPTTDYWYEFKAPNGIVFRGSISLKNK